MQDAGWIEMPNVLCVVMPVYIVADGFQTIQKYTLHSNIQSSKHVLCIEYIGDNGG